MAEAQAVRNYLFDRIIFHADHGFVIYSPHKGRVEIFGHHVAVRKQADP